MNNTNNTTNTTNTTVTRQLGANRNQPRLWLEGSTLARHGWTRGVRFDAAFYAPWSMAPAMGGAFVYTKAAHDFGLGKRAVAGTPDRPILDTNSKKLGTISGFRVADKLTVVITDYAIVAFDATRATYEEICDTYSLPPHTARASYRAA